MSLFLPSFDRDLTGAMPSSFTCVRCLIVNVSSSFGFFAHPLWLITELQEGVSTFSPPVLVVWTFSVFLPTCQSQLFQVDTRQEVRIFFLGYRGCAAPFLLLSISYCSPFFFPCSCLYRKWPRRCRSSCMLVYSPFCFMNVVCFHCFSTSSVQQRSLVASWSPNVCLPFSDRRTLVHECLQRLTACCPFFSCA